MRCGGRLPGTPDVAISRYLNSTSCRIGIRTQKRVRMPSVATTWLSVEDAPPPALTYAT